LNLAALAIISPSMLKGRGRSCASRPYGRSIMLRGRYGAGWMLVGWLVIVALIGAGIYLVGNIAHVFGG
jgi:hypothetical protein